MDQQQAEQTILQLQQQLQALQLQVQNAKFTSTASARAATSTRVTCTEATGAIDIYRGMFTSCCYTTGMAYTAQTAPGSHTQYAASTQVVDFAAANLRGSALIWYNTLKTAHGQTPFATRGIILQGITSHYLPYSRFDDAFGKLRQLQLKAAEHGCALIPAAADAAAAAFHRCQGLMPPAASRQQAESPSFVGLAIS
jgi:hypothetical protein